MLAAGRIRTDEEEERRRQTGENGRTMSRPDWERTEPERKLCKALEEVQKQEEDAAKKVAEEVAVSAGSELPETKEAPINALPTLGSLDDATQKLLERMTDLEYYFNDLRETMPKPEDVLQDKLVELGYIKPPQPLQPLVLKQGEDGEVPPPPPPVAKSAEELMTDCERLQRQIAEFEEKVEKGMLQLEAQRARNLTKDRDYHQLVAHNEDLEIIMRQVCTLFSSFVQLCSCMARSSSTPRNATKR